MNIEPWTLVATAAISTVVGLIGASIWGIVRKRVVERVRVSSPESRDIKRLSAVSRRHGFLIQAGADRQAIQAQGTIMLCNAVKTGDQEQVTRALDRISASESQYLAAIQARMTNEDVEDAEEA